MLIYRFFTTCGGPLISLFLRRRLRTGREDGLRFQERLGHAAASRPLGKLVWCHAASVGESLSVLRLLQTLQTHHPDWHVLITTGTVTSARLLQTRLAPRMIHQYVPVDRMVYVQRFLDHWKPDLALWVESELWPNMLSSLHKRSIPVCLLNGRMSERSFRRWGLIKNVAHNLLTCFTTILAQTPEDGERFTALGAKSVACVGHLKYAASPLAWDPLALDHLKNQIQGRKIWLMASTHAGEEEIAKTVHATLKKTYPDLLTLLVPRHPSRAQKIREILEKDGAKVVLRSENTALTQDTEFYIADTMGEMGLFFQCCPIVCMAGSFTWGGHNLVEPAQMGCAIVFGPQMTNFARMKDEILAAQAARQVGDAQELAHVVQDLINNPQLCASMGQAALAFAKTKETVLQNTLELLEPFLHDSA